MVKWRVFQPLYEQWAVWLQMNHNRACNEDSAATRGSSWWVQPLKLYLISVLCISCRPLWVTMQNSAMKHLISMLNNTECKHNYYSLNSTFLKDGFGHEFCLRQLALSVFGPHTHRSTMKAYCPHCAQYIYILPPLCTIYILPPLCIIYVLPPLCTICISPLFDTRNSYYFSIWQKTFILVPNSKQDLHIFPHFTQDIYIILWKQIRVFLRNTSIHHFVTRTEWSFCRWQMTNPSVCHVGITD
jgi:hypothetical protein